MNDPYSLVQLYFMHIRNKHCVFLTKKSTAPVSITSQHHYFSLLMVTGPRFDNPKVSEHTLIDTLLVQPLPQLQAKCIKK